MWTFVIAFVALMVSDSSHGEPFTVVLTAQDSENHRHSITFGFHPDATYGFDQQFGETPIPPVPSIPAFDVRFLDPFSRKQFPGDGAYRDIRPFVSAAQSDTFFVRGQPANVSYPLTFFWPKGLGKHFERILLRYRKDGSVSMIDMTKQTSFVMTEEMNSFEIITFGLKGKLPWTIP
jgi:hypothetical protein